MPYRLHGKITLPFFLATVLLSACAQRTQSLPDGVHARADSVADCKPGVSRAQIESLLVDLRTGYQSDVGNTEDYFSNLLQLYQNCLDARSADLSILARRALSQAEKVPGAGAQDWYEMWRIRLLLADIGLQNLSRNFLSARGLLEDLLLAYPDLTHPGHPLNAQISRIRLDLYDQLGQSSAGVQIAWQILMQEKDTRTRRALHERLWRQIDTMNPFARQALRAQSEDAQLATFIDIVTAWRQSLHGDGQSWTELSVKYVDHPALQFPVPEALLIQEKQLRNQPGQIALLVPLSGTLAPFGRAIRDGFISAAWAQSRQIGVPLPVIDVFDTTVYGSNIDYVLERAIDSGAEIIVGPLRKDLVKKTLKTALPVPVIALNYRSDELVPSPVPDNDARQIQMSLSDEDELWQIARLLDQLEVRAAGVLLPESKRGIRLGSFLEDYAALFGMRSSLIIEYYAPYEFDHSRPIRRMFALDKSDTRARATGNRLGVTLDFNARRRDDIDVVLVVADGQQLHSLHSQIQYQALEPIPVITTSASYALGKKYADELSGVYMTLMPWLISQSNELNRISGYWSGRYADSSYFFTFGADAWEVASLHKPLLEIERLHIPIHTGTVHLDEFGRLRREYVWARFVNGQAVEFDPVDLKKAIDAHWVPSWKRRLLID
ncbi:MAG: penicillin-binding protein activator [Gammaproteobacteria bacterium]|nr:penicillin-binding protein activator [Gammaproteobacteria bacterium]